MELNELPPQQLKQLMWKESTLLWAIDNAIKTEKGTDLEFKDRPFLKDIFDDWTPLQATQKSSQIAWSTTMIIKTLKAVKEYGWNVIYTLPTTTDAQQFVSSKVNSIINNSSLLSGWVKNNDSVAQKKVGSGFIYYRGTFSKKTEREKMESGTGIMLSSDLNVHDECDRSDQIIMEQYESRLDASEYKGRWFFSNPSHPNTLSQEVYKSSDQKHWFVKCSHCGLWQYIDYFKHICRERKMYICEKCDKELTVDAIRAGKWVKKYRNREASGYWVNHTMCGWKTAGELIKKEERTTKQYFMNFVLGLPYIGSDARVSKDIILKSIDRSEPNFLKGNVLGADSGLKKHYVIGNKQGIFKIGVADDWDEIRNFIKIYDIESVVLDALPDLTEPRKMQDDYPGLVWLSFFKQEVKKAEFISWDENTRTVYADRSKIIGEVIDRFIDRKIRIQLKQQDIDIDYINHWEDLYKITEKNKMGIEVDIWESSGKDHYALATIYWYLALQNSGSGKMVGWSGGNDNNINSGSAPDIQEILNKNKRLNE